MKTMLSTLVLSVFLVFAPAQAISGDHVDPVVTTQSDPASFQIDPVHSELSFRIRHLMGRVFGTFTEWEGTLVTDPADLSSTSVDVTVQAASINTLNEQRDDHLRSDDFFAADEYPTLRFTSTRTEVRGDDIAVHGDLTIRGVTRPVVLAGQFLGEGPDPWGGHRVAFLASTTIDRNDFGVSFNQLVEGVGMIGDEVDIEIAIEAVRQ